MKLGVVGAGSWGTALAQQAALNGHEVLMWSHGSFVADGINNAHRNPRYLSDIALSESISATVSLKTLVDHAESILVVTPSSFLREIAQQLSAYCAKEVCMCICSKGVESQTGALPIEIFASELGGENRLAVLSGPNHAEEVICAIPSATVIASPSLQTATFMQEAMSSDSFRVYTSDDHVGVEICAAAKNVVAIACGISYGLGLGDNTAASLMTRGLAEMSRLVLALGGKQVTCMGLAGMGDLIATCSSQHSRNRRLGEHVAHGGSYEEFVEQTHMVAEGAIACKTIAPLAQKHGCDMPLLDVVRAVLWDNADIEKEVEGLLHRPLRSEF